MSDIEQKLLTAKGDELSRLLGEVLQPEHSRSRCGDCKFHDTRKCKVSWLTEVAKKQNCFVSPYDIPLNDWNVAMKWRDWAVAEYGEVKFKQAMIDVYSTTTERLRINFSSWLALYAQPEHYLIAAALCKLKGNEDAN